MKNPYWDPNDRPGRHQYIDEFDFKLRQPTAKIDQILLADTGQARRR